MPVMKASFALPMSVRPATSSFGSGMPRELIRQIGKPFLSANAYVTKNPHKGTGLGLYICKKLAEAN